MYRFPKYVLSMVETQDVCLPGCRRHSAIFNLQAYKCGLLFYDLMRLNKRMAFGYSPLSDGGIAGIE